VTRRSTRSEILSAALVVFCGVAAARAAHRAYRPAARRYKLCLI